MQLAIAVEASQLSSYVFNIERGTLVIERSDSFNDLPQSYARTRHARALL